MRDNEVIPNSVHDLIVRMVETEAVADIEHGIQELLKTVR